MLLNITATSQKLSDLLSDSEKERVQDVRNGGKRNQVIFQSRTGITTEEVYISFGENASVGTSIEIAIGGILSFDEIDVNDINIVSKTGANSLILEFN